MTSFTDLVAVATQAKIYSIMIYHVGKQASQNLFHFKPQNKESKANDDRRPFARGVHLLISALIMQSAATNK